MIAAAILPSIRPIQQLAKLFAYCGSRSRT